ncbi:MAG TPA: hypothetical protein VL371_15470 [Gemmataceae bacterium]|jgi:anti-sigma factor RsiW|nr:hypothetical protein [Gemmataceae bacterium]
MTCDEVLPALEMGDVVQEQAARRHVRECPACAAAIDRWLALKASLTDAPALTDRDRAVWRDARRDLLPRMRRPRLWVVGAAAVAAAVLVALLWPRPLPGPVPVSPVETLAFSAERAEREWTAFDRQLDQVESELTTLSDRIARADAKRQAADLMDQYHR